MTLVDVLAYELADGTTSYRAVEAGRASEIVAAHEAEYRRRRRLRWLLAGLVVAVVVAYSLLVVQRPLLGAVAALGTVVAVGYRSREKEVRVPRIVAERLDRREAVERYELDVTPS